MSKKKRVVVRTSPVANVETAVLDIKLTAKSKMLLQHYTYVGLVASIRAALHLESSCKSVFGHIFLYLK